MSFALLVYSGVSCQADFQRSTERSSRCAHSDTAQVSRAVKAGRMWLVEKIEINGGVLSPGEVKIPPALNFIIWATRKGEKNHPRTLRFAGHGAPTPPKTKM